MTGAPDLVLGVEIGPVGAAEGPRGVRADDPCGEHMEIVMRMAESTGRAMRVEECPTDEAWCFLIVEEALIDA